MAEEMTNAVKLLLGISDEDTGKDDIIKYYVATVTQRVLNYCNIEKLPKGLVHIVVDKVVGLMKAVDPDSATVKSTSFGDTSVTYDTSINASDLLDDVIPQLNRFRRLGLND